MAMLSTLTTYDGARLHLAHWPAAVGAPTLGTVQIVHGLGEHIGRYAAFAQRLAAAGWHVVGHDQRGHGASDGERGRIGDAQVLLADVANVMDHFRSGALAQGRQVLLGHSLGGVVAARFVAEGQRGEVARWWRHVDALVLSSPALDPGMSAVQKLLLAVVGPLAPNLRLSNGLKPEWISRDPAVVQAYRTDPQVHDRVSPRLVRFLLDAAAEVQALAPRWRVPTLLLWAGADRCVAPRGSAAFAEKAPRAALEAQEYPGLFHELFNEPECELPIGHVIGWLQRLQARLEKTK
jgi:alpha-beta hydrolase superfamily lysophospholipase